MVVRLALGLLIEDKLDKTPNLQKLGNELFNSINRSVIVPYVERALLDWSPAYNECHGNVDYWVLNNQNCKAVRGWLLFDMRPILAFVRFTAHSVIEDQDGTLADITPSRASRQYPFVRHPDDIADFEESVEIYRVTNFDYNILA